MNPVFQKKIEQIVRLIRSKGVGLYFISQSPADIPDEILAQLGNRIQHALRAYTPKDQKAVKVAAESFRPNPNFNTSEEISNLGIGEALVSILDEEGVPTVVEKVDIVPTQSYTGAVDDAYRQELINISIYKDKYMETYDRESAYECLQQKLVESDVSDIQEVRPQEVQEQILNQEQTIDFNPQNNIPQQNQQQSQVQQPQNQQQYEEPQVEQEQKGGFSIQDAIGQTLGGIDLNNSTGRTRNSRKSNSGKSDIERIAQNTANTVAREVSRQIVRGIFGQIKL